jgi:hypothetical protein
MSQGIVLLLAETAAFFSIDAQHDEERIAWYQLNDAEDDHAHQKQHGNELKTSVCDIAAKHWLLPRNRYRYRSIHA